MSRRSASRAGTPALELIDSAVNLLRSAPAGALLAYYLGAIPGMLGLLYFWADMSRGAFARQHLTEAALGAAVLYLWMKCWQSVFASKLRAHLLMEPEAPWTFARIRRLICIQAAVQPTGLFARVVAALVMLPYVWTYGFYQNVGILGDGTESSLREVIRNAARQASLWPRQAHAALLSLLLFGLLIWINVLALVGIAPFALKTLLGIETIFSRSGWAMMNTTFLAASVAVAYLCFDPLRKAVFVLRCFQGASLQAGDDLRVELKALRQRSRPAVLAALLLACALPAPLVGAQETPPARVAPTQLDTAVEQVLQRREFAWRLPREAAAPNVEKSWLVMFFEGLWQRLTSLVKKAYGWLVDVLERVRKAFTRQPKPGDESSGRGGTIDWPAVAKVSLVLLGAAFLAMLGVVLWRRNRMRRGGTVLAQAIAAAPDLRREDVTADQLPEDGWLDLARELMSRGELRLALRASYLACLAHLGSRDLIQLEKFKSNRDYDRELRRRARANPELITAFDRNLAAFECAWYGDHAVTSESLDEFTANLQRIRAC